MIVPSKGKVLYDAQGEALLVASGLKGIGPELKKLFHFKCKHNFIVVFSIVARVFPGRIENRRSINLLMSSMNKS